MSAESLADVATGFDDPVHDAQRTFRCVLDALARPGTRIAIDRAIGGLDGLSERTPRSLAAVLLALADFDTPVWYDAACDAELAALLRFHAGAPIAPTPEDAIFAVICDAPRMPALDAFGWGTPEYPDRSATLLIALASLDGGSPMRLRGPGIRHETTIAPHGLPPNFWRMRAEMQAEFPRGVDIVLCDDTQLIGLPRTTRAVPAQEA